VLRAPGLCFARAWRAAVAVSLFGLCDEWRQSFTPGRFVEFADWVADTVGALVAVFVYQTWPAYRRLLEWRLPAGFGRRALSPPAP
jgi:VanZ family protein